MSRFRPPVRLLLAPLLALGLALSAVPAGTAAAETPPGRAAATPLQQVVRDMQPGWNLGNSFDAHPGDDETFWGNPRTSRELISWVADEGYRSIRIPVTWYQRMGPAPDYTIDPAFLDRVEQVVDWALAEDLYVMVDVHHDTSAWLIDMPTNRAEVNDRFAAIWTQVSERMADKSEKLVFEAINEPRFSEEWGENTPLYFELLAELNTTFHQIVRGSGGRNAARPLMLTTVTGSTDQVRLDALYDTIRALDDENLIATVHYYGEFTFSINVAGSTTFDRATEQDLQEAYQRVHDTFTARGIPVVLGEWGLLGYDKSGEAIDPGEVLKYVEAVGRLARELDLTTVMWDNGQHHVDRRDLTWFDPRFERMLKASYRTDSATPDRTVIHLRPDRRPEDVVVGFDLRGQRVRDLFRGDSTGTGTRLLPGRDYLLRGDQLTIRARALAAVPDDELGEAGAITVDLTAGNDWTFPVRVVGTPELEPVTGDVEGLVVPTRFAGDQLATMRSVDASGQPAGPWPDSPFQEFAVAFVPDVEAGSITLSPAYLATLADGRHDLTFVFRSGTEVGYRITVAGDTVTGRPTPS